MRRSIIYALTCLCPVTIFGYYWSSCICTYVLLYPSRVLFGEVSVQAFVHFQLGCWFFTAEIGLSTDEFEILPSPGYLLLHVNSIAVNEFKLVLLVPCRPMNQRSETRCWGTEYSFIQKVSWTKKNGRLTIKITILLASGCQVLL